MPSSSASLAPGPRGVPLLGSLPAAWRDVLGLFATTLRDHGEVSRLTFGPYEYYLVNDPEVVKHVLVDNAKNYTKSKSYDGLKLLLGQGLLTNEGESWKRQRRLAQPAFHRAHIDGFARTIGRVGEEQRARFRELAGEGRVVDLHEEMMHMTLRAVGLCLLGTDLAGDAKELGHALDVAIAWVNAYVESLVRLPAWVPTPRNNAYRRAERTIREIVGRVIDDRRARGETGTDLLGMLMAATDEEGRMSPKQLFDEVVTLTLAGHETTANSLTFALHLLHRHPDALAAVREEEARVLGGAVATLADLPKMPFTKAVIEESMRLFPPAWVVERQAKDDDEVCGLPVRRGDMVGVSPWAMHRSEALWDEPLAFRPERFLAPDDERPKLAYFPFGAGPRVCIGNAFAMMEMQILLPMLAAAFSFTLERTTPLEHELEPSITLRPKHGVPVRLSVR